MSERRSPEGLPEQHRSGANADGAEGQDRIQDPVEAEHIAYAMKPHVERAQTINKAKEQNWQDDALAPEGTSLGTGLTRHEFDRELHLEAERIALGDAEYHAQKAADEAGTAESERYRREPGSHDT
jgi:hypothetical protein